MKTYVKMLENDVKIGNNEKWQKIPDHLVCNPQNIC